MKKTLLRTILLSTVCCLWVQCAQNPADDLSPREMTDRQLLEFLGYDTRSMIERDAYLLLVPDIVIAKEELAQWRNKPQTRMQRGYGLLDEEYQTIYLNDDGIPKYADLLAQAVEEWNKIPNSNIEFAIDKTAAPVVDFIGDYAGDAFNPVSIQNPSRTGNTAKPSYSITPERCPCSANPPGENTT